MRVYAMNAASGLIALAGRVLLALIFVLAGYAKIWATAATATDMANRGIPLSGILVYGVIVLELIGGLMLMFGLYARWVAAAFFLYTLALALIFHPYWAASVADAQIERGFFLEHLSMMGGMLMIVALGAGPWSLDTLARRDADA